MVVSARADGKFYWSGGSFRKSNLPNVVTAKGGGGGGGWRANTKEIISHEFERVVSLHFAGDFPLVRGAQNRREMDEVGSGCAEVIKARAESRSGPL